ncbi:MULTISPECIES: hypothetical protein [Legionella]|uniref:hypothetical protein n=1 Tax=Legionella TaxID=445 RepID=UPI0013150544|nr:MULTISPECIES: hypothetical protein [Legionella]MCP0914546.1 hypothetical protein [Legionella sp. 27cVA30]
MKHSKYNPQPHMEKSSKINRQDKQSNLHGSEMDKTDKKNKTMTREHNRKQD